MSNLGRIERIANGFFAEQGHWLSRQRLFGDPQKVHRAYESHALIGAVVDDDRLPHDLRQYARACRDEFRAEQGQEARFATAAGTGDLYGDWKGQLCIPYAHHLDIDPAKAYAGAQLTGDCVSWAKRTSRDHARCFDIGELNEAEEYVQRSATADLYSMRGHTGAGASPSRIALAATRIGILLEGPIESPDGEVWDFSEYREYYKLGMRYGRTGLPRWIFEANRQYGPKQVAEIEAPEELLTALWNGCGCSVGSMLGVAKTGGHKGVPFLSRVSGSWAHDMAIIGFDDTRQHLDETIVIWDQSWGDWNRVSQSAWPAEYGKMPEGAFALTLSDTFRHAIRPGECHALSDSHGFRPRRQATMGAEGLI